MKKYLKCFLLFLAISHSSISFAADFPSKAIELNNAGVQALKKQDWENSFEKFELALRLAPSYQDAKKNLAIAHNNYALQLENERKILEASRHFHIALFMDESNQATVRNMNCFIRQSLGKKSDNFDDRVSMGDEALKNNDLMGAVVEYKEALKIKSDLEVKEKLSAVRKIMNTTKGPV